jgi:hypothetical protein
MKEVRLFSPLGDVGSLAEAVRELADATLIDALTIADSFEVSADLATTRALGPDPTLPELAAFVTTFINDLKKRGEHRVE